MGYNEAAFLILAALALAGGAAAGGRVATWIPPRLLLAAVALRIVGATARYEILWRFYDGVGDAVGYYWNGLRLSGVILNNPFVLVTPGFWLAHSNWWGTEFLKRISGVFLTFSGPSMRSGFLIFSLLSLGGLLALAAAFHHVHPGRHAQRYAAWIFLWPSLWFWPSSLGKEAVLVLGIGLAAYGYATAQQAGWRWAIFIAGLGLAFCIRPHVALVIAIATATAYWFGSWGRLTVRRVFEMVVIAILCTVAFAGMRSQFGLEDSGFEGMQEFVEHRSEQTLQGGSNIGAVPLGVSGVPIAFVNVWMRPFPWEAHNATAAFSALEIAVFWVLVWRRRRTVMFALRRWRRHPLLRFAIPFLFLYTLMIGIVFGNLGIIARQRAPIFPFLLMVLAAAPRHETARRQTARRTRTDPTGGPSPAAPVAPSPLEPSTQTR